MIRSGLASMTWASGRRASVASRARGRPSSGPASTMTYLTPAATSLNVIGPGEVTAGPSCRADSLSAATVVVPTRSASFQIMGRVSIRGQGSNTGSS